MPDEVEEMKKQSDKRISKSYLETIIGAVIFTGFVSGLLGIGGYYARRDENIELCNQYAKQDEIPENMCFDPCLRKHYLKLKQEYQIDNLNLVYNKAFDRCNKDEK